MKKIANKSLTILDPQAKRGGKEAKNLEQVRRDTLYTLAQGLKSAIERSDDTCPKMVLTYSRAGYGAVRLLVEVSKKCDAKLNDFVHGEIKIKKAKRTKIPGTNNYVFGKTTKEQLHDLARHFRLKKENAKK